MAENKYWKSLEEKYNHPDFIKESSKEFKDELPLLMQEKDADQVSGGRRDFLKFLGFSVTAATVAASCEMPVRKSIPYVVKPDEITPGIANYYASNYFDGSDFAHVLVKTREGRPIKIEANPNASPLGGGTSSPVQASVLSLYDNYRPKGPKAKGEDVAWEIADKAIVAKLDNLVVNGKKIALVSESIISPSLKSAIKTFIDKFPTARHVEIDAVSYSGIADAYSQSFGKRFIPSYQIDKANLLVAIGADFLRSWVAPNELSVQYGKRKKISKDNTNNLIRHIQFESILSLAGSNADTRVVIKPSQENGVVLALYNAVAALLGKTTFSNPDLEDNILTEIKNTAKELVAAKGKSLVISGSNDTNTQVLVNDINYLLENYGQTIDLSVTTKLKKSNDAETITLINEIQSGEIGGIIFLEANPLYNHPDATVIAEALTKMELSVSLSAQNDETSAATQYHLPAPHFLEAWGDVKPKSNVVGLIQPTIAPLFDTRSSVISLLSFTGTNVNEYDYIKSYWEQNIFSNQNKYASFSIFWDRTLHDGFAILSPSTDEALVYNTESLSASAAAVAAQKSSASEEIILYEKSAIRDGKNTGNPLLQEVPDSISKITWDNYVALSPKYAKDKGIASGDLVSVAVENVSIVLPAHIQPGTAYGVFAIALGYGRTAAGKAGSHIGKNSFVFVKKSGRNYQYFAENASLSKVGGTYPLALTQTYHSIFDGLNERRIVKETTLSEYKANPYAGNEDRAHVQEHLQTLYGYHDRPGHHWNLSVDLNSCIGCGSCVVACNVENNIPVVGKAEVVRSREMHWMRIDRYYSGDEENPSVVYQPMMCQHCENAPCENVCPVAATNHSSEGLNQMTYNRCIGTRYCANNCPYKVRRFNWFDYWGADSFNKKTIGVDNNHDLFGMTEDLTRMVLNPDVTVRSRGVIEKCSFCVQKIQAGKLQAKKAGEKLQDGAIKTACQSACPTHAIVFGDINDEKSEVRALANDERSFAVLEEIHTLPNVTYMTKVRNKEADVTKSHHAAAHH